MIKSTGHIPGGVLGGNLFAWDNYMIGKTPGVAGDFAQSEPEKLGPRIDGTFDIGKVLGEVKGGKTPEVASPMKVRGVFFPCILLTSGWWERDSKQKIADIGWRDPSIQSWLFRGFEEWAPSWDVSLETMDDPHPYLFGQLGVGDEAESLLVIVSGEKAKDLSTYIRDMYKNKKILAFPAEVAGLRTHIDHLEAPFKTKVAQWGQQGGQQGRKFKYCLSSTLSIWRKPKSRVSW